MKNQIELAKRIKWEKYYEITDSTKCATISCDHSLTEDFIEEFADKVDWFCISRNQTLSENFIRKFQNKVFWRTISRFQNLSESFIEEFSKYVDWYEIYLHQNLSIEFKKKHRAQFNEARLDKCTEYGNLDQLMKNVHEYYKNKNEK